MEFTPALSTLQGVIISADSVHSFSKLTTKGGNEKKIEYVIGCVRKFFIEENYIIENKMNEEHVQTLRKFAFYIVINSDLGILEEMVDLDGIDFVIWTIPTIKRCLLCEILWNLGMEKFIFEIIVYTSPYLGLEVAAAFIENLRYFEPKECLPKLKLLSTACYRLLARLTFFNVGVGEIKEASNYFQKCAEMFIGLPNNDRLDRLNKDEEYKFIGNRLYAILLVVLDIFTFFTSEQKKKPADFQEIYELTFKEDILKNNENIVTLCNSNNSLLLEYLSKTHIVLLDVCKILVMDVSVEIFCAWTEFEENGKSMQQTIGELCYKVHTTLSKIKSISDHPVVSMLQQISTKPLNFAEIINKTDPPQIIENINKGDDEAEQWLKALLYKDKLCDNSQLIEQLASHLEVLSEEECYKLFKIIKCSLKDCKVNKDLIHSFAIKVFQRCTSNIKYVIVEEHFSNETFSNALETREFDNMATEVFNKLIICPDEDFSVILCLFLQNPRKVYCKIFLLASENLQQADIMLKVMQCLDRFTKHYYNEETESSIISITNEIIACYLDTEEKKSNFIRFLSSIKTSNAIPGPKLLLLVIMPNLHNGILNKNIDQICIQCKVLQEAFTLTELVEYRAPTLAMLSQVLDTVRWKINTFSTIAPSTLELVLQLQTSLLNTYEGEIPEKEFGWLKCKLRNIHPLNMYYFRRLWNPPGNTFVEVISGIRIYKDMDIEHLIIWLSQVISATILQEWYQMWDSLSVFGDCNILDIFHKALILLCTAEKTNHSENTKSCVLYCIKNFIAIIRYKFFKLPLKNKDIVIVFNKFAALENLMEEGDIMELENIFFPLLSYVAEKKEAVHADMLQCFHYKFKHKIFIDMINNILSKRKDLQNKHP